MRLAIYVILCAGILASIAIGEDIGRFAGHMTRLDYQIIELKKQDSATIKLAVEDLLRQYHWYPESFVEKMIADTIAFNLWLEGLPLYFQTTNDSINNRLEGIRIHDIDALEKSRDSSRSASGFKAKLLPRLKSIETTRIQSQKTLPESEVVRVLQYQFVLWLHRDGAAFYWLTPTIYSFAMMNPNGLYAVFIDRPDEFTIFLERLGPAVFTNLNDTTISHIEMKRLESIDFLKQYDVYPMYLDMHNEFIDSLKAIECRYID